MLSQDVTRYVELHRVMGFKFHTQNILLRHFASFAERQGNQFVLTRTAVDWAGQAPSPPQRHNRLATVRRFALAMHAEDPEHQVPSGEVFGRQWFRRRTPHIYTREQISRLIGATARLSPRSSISPITYSTLFALLASTGLRVSEALALDIKDLTNDGLLIRQTKFKKSRLVPVHETTRAALARYQRVRSLCSPTSPALLISCKGERLNYNTVQRTFLSLARSSGLRGGQGQRGPRMHDLRHTFAVRALERCVGDSRDKIARHMVALSTYLGHAHISDTYWYLQATPALMRQIARAGETLHGRRAS